MRWTSLTVFVDLFLCYCCQDVALRCRDDDNRPVDWIIAYKFPTTFSYASLTPNSIEWKRSSKNLNGIGFLRYTYEQVFNSTAMNNSLVYGMYNDEIPDNATLTSQPWWGHMKGLFAFNKNSSGFWLIHSVPKLSAKMDEFEYPVTGETFGQHFVCISLPYSTLPEISNQLVIARPLVQSHQLPDDIAKEIPVLKDVFSHRQSKIYSSNRTLNLTTLDKHLQLKHFSKSTKFNVDLYKDFVAPGLNASLLVETWRHTHSDLKSNCTGPLEVLNIVEIAFPKPIHEKFNYTHDHSKLAVSEDATGNTTWVCLGDINRAKSQFYRGGGTLCINHPTIWAQFNKLVKDVEECNQSRDSFETPAAIPWLKLEPARKIDL